MKLSSLKSSGHAPTLLSAFLHFDVSFMIWVIIGALAPFIASDPLLTGVNLRVTPLSSVSSAHPYTLIVKPGDSAKGQSKSSYVLMIKPGSPAQATRSSVKPVESFVLDDSTPNTIERVNSQSRYVRIAVDPQARGNPHDAVLALTPPGALRALGRSSLPLANGYPASVTLTLIGIPLLAAGFWRILLGLLADRFGSKRIGTISMAATMLPLALGWQAATSYAALVWVGIFLGIAGPSFAVALPLASRWYPPQMQGVVMGIAGAGNSGTVMATILAPVLAHGIGWHGVFGLLLVPVGITLLLFAVLAKDPPAVARPFSAGEIFGVLRTRDAWSLCLLYFVTFGGFVGLSSFVNTFFVDAFDAPKASVGLWTWPFIVAGSLVRPLGGLMSDRWGGIRMLTALFTVAGLASLGVAICIGSFAGAFGALFVLMAALAMGNGSVFQLVPQRFRNEIGLVTGLVGAAGGVGGYYLNIVLGHLHDSTGSYAAGFAAFAGMTVVATLALRLSAPSWTRSWLAEGGRARAAAAVQSPTAPTADKPELVGV